MIVTAVAQVTMAMTIVVLILIIAMMIAPTIVIMVYFYECMSVNTTATPMMATKTMRINNS